MGCLPEFQGVPMEHEVVLEELLVLDPLEQPMCQGATFHFSNFDF